MIATRAALHTSQNEHERAIELAVTKYCSVRDSLDPATPVEWELELED